MTLHMHVGPGLESFVRKTSFVFIVAILLGSDGIVCSNSSTTFSGQGLCHL